MQIGVFGSGYLGTVISACMADLGTPVTCFDPAGDQIRSLAEGSVPFYEKNLEEIIRRNVRAGRLRYSTEMESQASRSQILFIAPDSPQGVEDAMVRLASVLPPDVPVVLCSPVSVGTASRVEKTFYQRGMVHPIVSYPLFLTHGCAVEDFNWPDRILLGSHSPEAVAMIKTLFRPLIMRGVPVIVTNFETAELVREAATAFVATKVSFINELAALCEHVHADACDLALALGLDKRIAPRCLSPGVGLGGSFVESDMESLAELAMINGVPLKVLAAAREVRQLHTATMLNKIASVVQPIRDKRISLLGLAFKPNTSSVEGSASIALARELSDQGATISAYDPFATAEAQRACQRGMRYFGSAYEAVEGADAVVIGTGWPEFRALDFVRLKKLLKRPLIVDTKNLLDADRLRDLGFEYMGIGRAQA